MFNLIFKKSLINNTFIKFNKFNISREDVITNEQLKKRLKSKWELRKSKSRESFIVNNNPGKVIINNTGYI